MIGPTDPQSRARLAAGLRAFAAMALAILAAIVAGVPTPQNNLFGPAVEVYNSGRGMYSWLTIPSQVPGWQYRDVYWRDQIQWGSQVEKTKGSYNFSVFEAGLAEAQKSNGRFSFRIMALCPGCGGNLAPSYVPRQANGAPDWNSEAFLSGYERLMAALGARYGKDPRLGVIDVGAYGLWGEWYCDEKQCGTQLTDKNTERILRAVSNAFPEKYLALGFSDKAASLAAKINPKIGLRFDCIGGFPMTLKYLPEPVKTVWKRAPVIGEWCPIPGSTATQGVSNVKELHLSMLSSGNFATPYAQLSATEQTAYKRAYTLSGFRYSVSSVSAPTTVSANTSVPIAISVTNSGVAPTYDSWTTRVMLVDSAGKTVASAALPLDLKSLAEGSASGSVNLTLPRTLNGTYKLAIAAADQQSYLKPLAFANPDRDSEGRYILGTMSVKRT